jgi:hypothetical protein
VGATGSPVRPLALVSEAGVSEARVSEVRVPAHRPTSPDR